MSGKRAPRILKTAFLPVLALCLTGCILFGCILFGCILTGCTRSGKVPVSLEFGSTLDGDARTYFTGQPFDCTVTDAYGNEVSKIPHVYAVYEDGSRSEDLSHSDRIRFSDYDLSKEGEQFVTVTYREGLTKLEGSYLIYVQQTRIERMTVSDPLHSDRGSFAVGEKFTVYTEPEPGVGRGVTVTLIYNDPSRENEVYFAVDPALEGIRFDTSACALDENGCFTEAGAFPVGVTFGELSASYRITVTG